MVPLRLRNSGKDSVRCTLTISDVVSKCDSGYTYLDPGSTAERLLTMDVAGDGKF